MSDSDDLTNSANTPDTGNRFSRRSRLRTQSEFRRVYDSGQRSGDATLLIIAARNELDHTRIGLSVSKKHGCAVTRNIKKRRLREAFRTARDLLPTGLDLILIPRLRRDTTVDDYQRSLVKLSARLGRMLPASTAVEEDELTKRRNQVP